MSQAECDQARSLVYHLLSSLFAWEINEQRQQQLTSPDALAFWQQLSQDTNLKQPVQILLSTLTQMTSKQQRLELAADFCGLFLIGDRQSVSPYASFYLDSDTTPTLFGQQHQVMHDFLRRSKLVIQSNFKEPADHLAVMLALMAHLCTTSSKATQLSFLQTCIHSWLAAFVSRVQQCDPGQFYSALATMTLIWVNDDVAALSS